MNQSTGTSVPLLEKMNAQAIIRFSCPIAAFSAVQLSAVAEVFANANLVSNPSFESGVAGYSHAVWTGQAQVRVTSSAAHSGAHCLEITGKNASATVWQTYAVP